LKKGDKIIRETVILTSLLILNVWARYDSIISTGIIGAFIFLYLFMTNSYIVCIFK